MRYKIPVVFFTRLAAFPPSLIEPAKLPAPTVSVVPLSLNKFSVLPTEPFRPASVWAVLSNSTVLALLMLSVVVEGSEPVAPTVR